MNGTVRGMVRTWSCQHAPPIPSVQAQNRSGTQVVASCCGPHAPVRVALPSTQARLPSTHAEDCGAKQSGRDAVPGIVMPRYAAGLQSSATRSSQSGSWPGTTKLRVAAPLSQCSATTHELGGAVSVSYTHLTLPTSDLV